MSDQLICELEAQLRACQQRCAELEEDVHNLTITGVHELWRAEQRAHAETTADRDELRAELARLRSEILAYVESNNAIRIENG